MKNRLAKLIEKDGFYIILFICVCVVAITAVMVSRRNLNDNNEDNLSNYEDFIIIDQEEEPSLESARMEEDQIVTENEDAIEDRETEEMEEAEEIDNIEETEEAMANVEDEDMEEDKEKDLDLVEEEVNPPQVNEAMMAPVAGQIITDFTKDSLVYSETLDQWTGHSGIDILAEEGTSVVAALSGKILEVYNDRLWGKVIIIDHGNGLLTKYANLSTTEMVQEGVSVNKGDVISKVGTSASIEMMMDPHIHFEVIKDGLSLDPKDYINP